MPGLTLDDFSDAYTRWGLTVRFAVKPTAATGSRWVLAAKPTPALLRCPCCGGEICAWWWHGQDHEPQAIGEGVVMCGRCIGNGHHNRDPNFTRLMLQAIALGARRRWAQVRENK